MDQAGTVCNEQASGQQGYVTTQEAASAGFSSQLLLKHIHAGRVSRSRRGVPPDVIVHHGDVPKRERSWFGAIPATSPARALADCAHEKIAPDLLRQAARDALRRGLVKRDELTDVRQALRGFGGLAA
jgi:hypothetical protein